MPVGHGGNMSKHPPKVKLAILEFIEARLKDIVPEFDLDQDVVDVYDPITTEWDFYVFLDVSWDLYEKIYGEYFNTDRDPGDLEREVRKRYPDIIKAFPKEIFNATDSKTEIFKTIDEMYELYPHLDNPREA